MQFTATVVSLFLAATSVQAHPGALAERQQVGVTYQFRQSCPEGPIVGEPGEWIDTAPNTPGESDCLDINAPIFPGPQIGIEILTANSRKNLTVWNVNECTAFNNSGNYVEFDAGETGCKILPRGPALGPIAQSVQFGTINPSAPRD